MGSPASRFLGFLALLTACAGGLLLVGYLPTKAWGGEAALRGMWFGCALSYIGSVVGSLPLVAASGSALSRGPASLLASLGLRFFLVLAGAAAVALLQLVEPRSFLLWVAASYLVFLVADVRYALIEQRTR